MSDEAFGWGVLLAFWFSIFGLGACILAVYGWYESRKKPPLLPNPEWRARVHQNQTGTHWRVDK